MVERIPKPNVPKIPQSPDKKAYEVSSLSRERTILQAVLDHHEDKFTVDSDYTKIGEYSAENVRSAFKAVTQELLNTHKEQSVIIGISKKDAAGSLIIGIGRPRVAGSLEKRGTIINLTYTKKGDGIGLKGLQDAIVCQLPVDDNAFMSDHRFIGFRNRWDTTKGVNMHELKEKFSADAFQEMWLGYRWVAGNLLHWDSPDIILPEEVDSYSKQP
jgi:hypothetical protein